MPPAKRVSVPAKPKPRAVAKPRKAAARKAPATPEGHARLTKQQLVGLIEDLEAELQKLRGLPESAVAATKRDLAKYPENLRQGAEAANALALAKELDRDNPATSKSMCARAHLEVMDRLRELAPPEETHDHIDEVGAQRERRRDAAAAAAREAGAAT